MDKSEQINELASALSKAQGVIIPASKDADNPFFKSRYADLASVWEVARKPLSDNGLSVTQHPSAEGNIVSLLTILLHSSGQWMSSILTMVAKDASPQAVGSCLTYERRYALSAIVGIASEIDDDANSATVVKGKNDEIKPPEGALSMIHYVTKSAKEKFNDPDKFKAWRIDNNFPEKLEVLDELTLAQIWNALKKVK